MSAAPFPGEISLGSYASVTVTGLEKETPSGPRTIARAALRAVAPGGTANVGGDGSDGDRLGARGKPRRQAPSRSSRSASGHRIRRRGLRTDSRRCALPMAADAPLLAAPRVAASPARRFHLLPRSLRKREGMRRGRPRRSGAAYGGCVRAYHPSRARGVSPSTLERYDPLLVRAPPYAVASESRSRPPLTSPRPPPPGPSPAPPPSSRRAPGTSTSSPPADPRSPSSPASSPARCPT